MWQSLIANLAVVALFVSAWNHAQPWLETRSSRVQRGLLSLLMGCGSVASMLLAVQLHPGVIFDLRMSLIATAGLFGGPPVALAASVLPAAYRLFVGGEGVLAGLVGILLAGVGGATIHVLARPRFGIRHILLLAVTIGLALLMSATLLPEEAFLACKPHLMQLVALNGLATVLAGLAIFHTRQLSQLRDLLRAGFVKAPDFCYIKDFRGRFIAVNDTVACYSGYASPSELRGKSDHDLVSAERAQALALAEQQMLATGQPLVNVEECLPDADGKPQWFLTSKTPLYDQDGHPTGLTGVTRNITAQKELEATLRDSENLLSHALTEMSDGLAMFDQNGFLVLCNPQYQNCFPLTADVRKPGKHLRDILLATIETGEQRIEAGTEGLWVERVLSSLHEGGEQQVCLFDGRWLSIRTRPTSDGRALVLVSDITDMKRAEGHLTTLSNQLQELANTDPLLGIANRRSFDRALSSRFAELDATGQPFCLLLIDVDRFKAYNDRYGHPAGDACLRTIAQCLRARARSQDMVARYGGEEFAILLPNAPIDGALRVARDLLDAVRAQGLPHEQSEKGVVTISIGIAEAIGGFGLTPELLIANADAALYDAKANGRDTVKLADNQTASPQSLHG